MKRKLLYFLMVAMFAIVLPSCGGHPEIDVEKISDYVSRIDAVQDEYNITADDTDGIVGQYQAVVDKAEEYGKDNVWKKLGEKYPGKSSDIMRFSAEMGGIAFKQKQNLKNDGMVWGDVKRLPFTSSQVQEIIAQSERFDALK